MLNSSQLVLRAVSLAVPVRPINAEIIFRAIKYGILPAIFVSLGALLENIVYFALIIAGLNSFIELPYI